MALVRVAGKVFEGTLQHTFLPYRMPHTLSNRQRAEIQLKSLLDDPEASLPVSMLSGRVLLSDKPASIEQVSKRLNTQPFIIERLANALFSTSVDQKRTSLSKSEVQKLTRVLNGTTVVRSLLFFMMLDANDDRHVTQQELSRFFEEYFKGLKVFDRHRQQEFIDVLSQKFQLNQPVSSKRVFRHRYTLKCIRLECTHRFRTVLCDCVHRSDSVSIIITLHCQSRVVH